MKKLMTTLRDILIGLVLFLIALFLVSCGTGTPFDPNLAAQDAQYQVERYSAMATGTAQAQIVPITQTAGAQQAASTGTAQALAYQHQMWTVTAQSVQSTQTAAMTQTAMSWTPTANIPATVAAEQAAAQIQQLRLDTEKAQVTNTWRSFREMLFTVVLLICLVAGFFVLLKKVSITPHTVDERGRIVPVINVLEGTIVDIERSANGMVDMSKKFLAQLPAITAERQADVTTLAQKVDMSTRAKLPLSLLKKLDQLENPERPALPAPDEEQDPILIDYPLPEWNDWMQNWKPGFLALGINEHGLLQVDPETNAHFLFAGTTGSGKTRSGVRVLITCALASGWQVIIAGKDLDYKVFENHPNAYRVPFSLLIDPTRAIDLLRSVYAEIEQRTRMMSRSNYGLWKETGQSRTMVVVDEFSNLADALEDIDRSRRDELWRWARMDTAEARKYGIHMVYALQDPTAKSIDLRIRRNTTPVMFRVKDAASSRTLLNVGGAEMLSVRHFLANIARLERGAAFAPSDPDILQFLHEHPARAEDPPSWVEGVLVQDPALDEGRRDLIEGPAPDLGQPTDSSWLQSLTDEQHKIIDMHIEGKSQAQICKELFNTTGGTAFYKVKDVIARYKAIKTSSSTQNISNLSTSPA